MFPLVIPLGWQCPKCQRIYAPSVTECFACQPMPTTIGTIVPLGWPPTTTKWITEADKITYTSKA